MGSTPMRNIFWKGACGYRNTRVPSFTWVIAEYRSSLRFFCGDEAADFNMIKKVQPTTEQKGNIFLGLFGPEIPLRQIIRESTL